MRILKLSALILVLILALSACSKNVSLYKQAKSQYQKGNFEQALYLNTQSLMIKPSYAKAQELLRQTYPQALANREKNVARIRAEKDLLMWDKLVVEYQALVNIQNTMGDLPRLVHPKTGEVFMYDVRNYHDLLRESKTNAAEYHYQRAVELSRRSKDPEVQKEAAKEFKLAMEFIPDYKDSAVLYSQARKLAVKRVAIMPFEDKTGLKSRFGGIPDMLVDGIISALLNDKASSEFLEIITRGQINAVLAEQQLSTSGIVDESSAAQVGQLLGAHEIMTGKILQINIVPAKTQSVELKESATIEVEPKSNDNEEVDPENPPSKIKTDVTCLYTKFTKSTGAQITASYHIIEVATGRIKMQDSFTSNFNWSDTWARKGPGDERALSPATKAMIAKTEPMPPSEVEMVNSALRSLTTLFVNQIKEYVK